MAKLAHYLARSSWAISGIVALVIGISLAFATATTHGDLAAAVRSANYPCAHVVEIAATGDRRWRVQCNSGNYLVEQAETGGYRVEPED